MRGKVTTKRFTEMTARITPAYAGKRNFTMHITHLYGDHPRLCGEKPDWDGLDKTAQGSPPPMRGKAVKSKIKFEDMRITPAYAGKSVATLYSLVEVQDHPRLCGEKRKR